MRKLFGKKAAVATVAAAVSRGPGIDLLSLNEPFYHYVALLVALHMTMAVLVRRVDPFKFNPGLLAHQVCSLVCIVQCGYWGVKYWFGEASTADDRLYGFLPGAVHVGKWNFAFQVYDLFFTILEPRLRKVEMVVHHTLAATLCYLLLRDNYVHYYSIFFVGMSEVSSFPLVFVDLFKYFPELAERFGGLNDLLRISFAIMFLGIRVIYWPFISVAHIIDSIASIKAGTVHNAWVVGFFFVGNLTLTVLQWFWGYLIVRAAVKMVSKSKASKNNSNTKKE